jgi:hypothetical protein
MNKYLFEVSTPIQCSIHTTREYWEKLLVKHPELKNKLENVKEALQNPLEIRKSKKDEMIFLFYLDDVKYWLCVVVKKNELEGFLVTAYITDSIKEGETIWQR